MIRTKVPDETACCLSPVPELEEKQKKISLSVILIMIPLCWDAPHDSKQNNKTLVLRSNRPESPDHDEQFPQRRSKGLEGKVHQRYPWNSEPIKMKLFSSET